MPLTGTSAFFVGFLRVQSRAHWSAIFGDLSQPAIDEQLS